LNTLTKCPIHARGLCRVPYPAFGHTCHIWFLESYQISLNIWSDRYLNLTNVNENNFKTQNVYFEYFLMWGWKAEMFFEINRRSLCSSAFSLGINLFENMERDYQEMTQAELKLINLIFLENIVMMFSMETFLSASWKFSALEK